MWSPLIIFMIIPITVSLSQTLSPSFSGCVTKDGHNQPVIIANNDTMADENWWYECQGTTLIARGCVIDGTRYSVGDIFVAQSASFYGRCEEIDNRYLKANLLGCVDWEGKAVEPGRQYVLNRYFWANCTANKRVVHSKIAGDVELDVISRQIIGCNDGTYDIVPAGTNFPSIRTDKPLLAGVGVICKLDGAYPQIEPVVCLVANSSKDATYNPLGSGCYGRFRNYVYYCSIDKHDLGNGTLEYSWEVGWNTYNDESISALKSKSFHDCNNSTSSPRRRRSQNDHDLTSTLTMIERYTPIDSWLEESSRFIET